MDLENLVKIEGLFPHPLDEVECTWKWWWGFPRVPCSPGPLLGGQLYYWDKKKKCPVINAVNHLIISL